MLTALFSYRLEGYYVLHLHRHSHRVDDLLYGQGLERTWRLAQLKLVINRLRPSEDTHTLVRHWWELQIFPHQLWRVDSRDFGRLGQLKLCSWKRRLIINLVRLRELNFILEGDVIVALVDNFVLAELRLAGQN